MPDGIVGPQTWKALPDNTTTRTSVVASAVVEPARLAWGKKVSAEFRRQVAAICDDLAMNPDHLMACMAFESGRTFSPSKENLAGSGAIGLIQFMPATAQALGTSTEALRAMSAEQQLTFVHKYFRPQKGKLHNLGDVYMAILWPLAVGKPDSFALFVKGQEPVRRYLQNRGLDIDADGVVTRAEACAKVQDALDQGLRPENCFGA